MVKIAERLWRDIRRGENIDLYLTVCLAVGLAVLNILGVVPAAWIIPLDLAVLGLLSVAILGNRYRLETLLERVAAPHEGLLTEFPDDVLQHDIDKARHLMLLGVDLNLVLRKNYAHLEKTLARGQVVRVLLVNPDSPACSMAATLHYEPMTCEDKREVIQRSLRSLRQLQQQTEGKLEIRFCNHLPTFGAFVTDLDTPDGAIYLWHYAFKAPDTNRMKLILRHQDGYWYESFRAEILAVWSAATPVTLAAPLPA